MGSRNGEPINMAPSPTRAARDASIDLRHKIQFAGALYGDPLALVLSRAAEVAQDRYEDLVIDLEDRCKHLSQEATRARQRSSRVATVLREAALEIQSRYRGGNQTRLPDEYLRIIEAAAEDWPYVWPPADERHVHSTNSGGACRHPLCHYHSDGQGVVYAEPVEPF